MKPPSSRDRAVFLRSLALMLGAGVSLLHALDLLEKHADSPALATVSGSLRKMLEKGVDLPKAFAAQGQVFDSYHLGLIKIGCTTGSLVFVLDRLAIYEERRDQANRRAKAALVYPCFVLAAALALLIAIPVFLIKCLSPLILASGAQPSRWTQILISTSAMAQSPIFWIFAIVAVGGLLALGTRIRRDAGKRAVLAAKLLGVPGLGPALKTMAACRFARAFELLSVAGCPMLQALDLAGQACGHPVLERASKQAAEKFRQGEELCSVLSETGFFSRTFISSLEVGLAHGCLSTSLASVTELMEVELEMRFKAFQELLEPVILLSMGLVVGFTILAAITPLLEAMQRL